MKPLHRRLRILPSCGPCSMTDDHRHDGSTDTEAVDAQSIRRLVDQPPQETATVSDADRAVEVARALLIRSRQLQTPQEHRQQAELDRMIRHAADKATLVEMTDQAFRTRTAARVADQLTHILDLQGVPRFFSPLDRTMLRGFQSFGGYLPGVAVPLVKDKMRRETANVVLPAEPELLTEHLRQRHREGVRMNVNLLGEALLGEADARGRLKAYIDALADPAVECISVKISTIYSQISPLARQHTIDVVSDRMELLYRTSLRHPFVTPDTQVVSKFVYLDMEEYRDMHLTAEILRNALDREGLAAARAGIALQAYLPDSFPVMESLIDWSRRRVAAGGSPLTIRVVKGANLEMERVEASIGGWPQAPYQTKTETDANYKRMLDRLMAPEHAPWVRVGVASHNLFDLALALVWASQRGVEQSVQFEMLEGMANHQRRALFEVTGKMLLYAPACRREDFLHAIGYLIRRLDENTGESNFLRHAFRLQPDTPQWQSLQQGFRRSLAAMPSVSSQPRRKQDRRQPPPSLPPVADHWSRYENEPDTDWALPHHAVWANDLLKRWQTLCDQQAHQVPLVIDGQQHALAGRRERHSTDPSRPGVVICRYIEATDDDVDAAVAAARDDRAGWRKRSHSERHAILRQAAQQLRLARGELIGAAIGDGGKTIAEADPEVSEAVDFTEFYALAAGDVFDRHPASAAGRGVVAVTSPWNFPIAIPCGGVAAALAAGNTVILKPASDTVLTAYKMCQCFWDAGVPPQALQLVPCSGSGAGSRLVAHPDVDVVILTGGTETARQMLSLRSCRDLMAETGGKNATIVTALSDREQAIKHVVHSAFSHGGQKCSATSLLLLEREVYEDRRFCDTLADAVSSLRVGSCWDAATRMGPLIRPPSGVLARGMKELEPGESWLVMPEHVGDNPNLYRPGIKWNVRPGGFTHRTELFGPVLAVMPFERLEEAVGIVNATGYGLTSGLESLDSREQAFWQQTVRAGNLYINRPTTGAIVLRQPFGGMGKSAYGPGVKAGGPNYVVPLMRFAEPASTATAGRTPTTATVTLEPLVQMQRALNLLVERALLPMAAADRVERALRSIDQAVRTEFGQQHDSVRLLGQDNYRRYLPVAHLRIRIRPTDSATDLLIAAAAAAAVGCRAVLSCHAAVDAAVVQVAELATAEWAGRVEWIEEDDSELAEAIAGGDVDRLRLLSAAALAPAIAAAIREAFVPVLGMPVSSDGRIEALWYVQEQSLCHQYHRYGNLGRRSEEKRRPVR